MSLAADTAGLDATDQAELVAAGQLSAVEVVQAAIERIEALDPAINAVVIRRFEKALADARDIQGEARPFGGVPTVFKDVTAAAGEPRTFSVSALRDVDNLDHDNSNVVAAMSAAGFVNLGKASMPQLAGGISTEPAMWGPCRNPWNLDYSVGGSSGGSAAAVAAGMVPIAHGTDGGGSVRIPASLCGLVGLKPTRGRISLGPDFTDTEGFTVASVLTRSVRDTAGAIDAISGYRPGDPWYAPPLARSLTEALRDDPPRLRVGVWTPSADFHARVDPSCAKACADVGATLESLGHYVDAAYPKILDGGMTAAFMTCATSVIAREVTDLERLVGREFTAEDLEPVLWAAGQIGKLITGVQYQAAIASIRADCRQFTQWWHDGWDLLVTPTLAVPPYPIGATSAPSADTPWPDVNPWIPFTGHFNLAGLPAISLPLATAADGLPIGVQLGAAIGREDVLIAVAGQLERAQPWQDRWPEHSYVGKLTRPASATI
jgi:amidase